MFTCCCCGYDFEQDEVEEVVVGMEGAVDFMCRRCFREDCDCNEPMYVLEDYRLDAEFAHQSRQFFTYGDYLPYTEK